MQYNADVHQVKERKADPWDAGSFICLAKVLVLMMTGAQRVPAQASTCWSEERWLGALLPARLPSVPVNVVCIFLELPSQAGGCFAQVQEAQPAEGSWESVWLFAFPFKEQISIMGKKRLCDSTALRTQPGQWRQQWDFSKLESNLATHIYFLF